MLGESLVSIKYLINIIKIKFELVNSNQLNVNFTVFSKFKFYFI